MDNSAPSVYTSFGHQTRGRNFSQISAVGTVDCILNGHCAVVSISMPMAVILHYTNSVLSKQLICLRDLVVLSEILGKFTRITLHDIFLYNMGDTKK